MAKSLGLGELEDALERLRDDRLTDLADGLSSIARRADAAATAMDRLATANDNVIRVNTAGIAQLKRSLGALTIVPGGGGVAGGGAGAGGLGGAAPLLLAGPGGIPLNLRPGTGRLGRAGAGLRQAGAGVVGAASGLGDATSNAAGGMMGAAMDGFAVYEPIRAYAGYENILRHIAITEKLSGAAAETEIKRLSTLFAGDALETGQSSESIARAYSDLVQGGISSKIIDRVIGQHSHAATAYNISAEALGPAVGALLQNMNIPEGQIGSALAAMAYASKEGRFKVEDFSRQLPGTTGYLSLLGMTGRHSADLGFAALETVMKNSAEPNQAAANFNDALHYLTSPIAKRSFAKGGIDLPGLLQNAGRKGIDPLDAVLGNLDQRTAGMDPVKAAEYLGTLLHNQQAGMGVLSLLQHKGDYLRLTKQLDQVDGRTLATDYATASAAPEVQLRKLTEQTEQLNRTLGEGFVPTLKIVGSVLNGLLSPLTWLNEHFPKVTQGVLSAVGGFLLLAAGVGIFKVVAPLFVGAWKVVTATLEFFGAVLDGVVAGLGLLLSPIGLVISAIALVSLAAYEVYEHWSTIGAFFVGVWRDAKAAFTDFSAWAETWATALADRINKALSSIHFSLDLHTPFGPDSAVGRMLHADQLTQLPQLAGVPSIHNTPAGQPAGRTDSLAVTVKADPGTAVTTATSTNPNHIIAVVPNPGRTLNRP